MTDAEPLVGQVAGGEAFEFAGAADAVEGGVEPECEQDAGVDGRVADVAFDGLDGGVQWREVELQSEGPDGADHVVGREELIEGFATERHLVAAGKAKSWLGHGEPLASSKHSE